MKTKTALLILFCLILNFGLPGAFAQNSGKSSPCDDSRRYLENERPGITDVDSVTAKQKIMNYRNKHRGDSTPFKTTGFKISKKALDEIFSDPDLNEISIDLIEEEGSLNIIVKGQRSENTGIEVPNNSSIYKSKMICPTDCSAW